MSSSNEVSKAIQLIRHNDYHAHPMGDCHDNIREFVERLKQGVKGVVGSLKLNNNCFWTTINRYCRIKGTGKQFDVNSNIKFTKF